MTTIEWSQNPDGTPGESWNPVRGCQEISPGCARCYAKAFAERFRGVKGHPYEQGFDPRLVPEKLTHPFKFKKPTTFFVNSMSDLWMDAVPFEYIAAVFGVMAACPQHRFITLTKREKRMVEWYDWLDTSRDDPSLVGWLRDERRPNASVQVLRCMEWFARSGPIGLPFQENVSNAWPLPNVLVGVSVENKKHGVPRIDELRKVPAAVRVLSIEPLLEDLGQIDLAGIGWVLIGGESGIGARRCALEWIESIVQQCREARVPAFVKQLGARPTGEWRGNNAPTYHLTDITVQPPRESAELSRTKGGVWKLRDRKGGSMEEWPAHLRVRETPEVSRG